MPVLNRRALFGGREEDEIDQEEDDGGEGDCQEAGSGRDSCGADFAPSVPNAPLVPGTQQPPATAASPGPPKRSAPRFGL
ncbi:hypothetical protein [Streptomyces lancefieldiae]|uniref:Uncharacterized protein n=1 Tax=Streptomyces lancefieldiae TaxID=3075520 RepID=A0ABU3B103_9ACTN|nr:hypothetical protein [Streptomyces sp. DSM 40712]MDT0616121.1 hypothetical protein [Streptomyces sp. DSM 40712]